MLDALSRDAGLFGDQYYMLNWAILDCNQDYGRGGGMYGTPIFFLSRV